MASKRSDLRLQPSSPLNCVNKGLAAANLSSISKDQIFRLPMLADSHSFDLYVAVVTVAASHPRV